MSDGWWIALGVLGTLYVGETIKSVNKTKVDGEVECQRLKSDASKAAAEQGVTLPQCEESVVNFAGIKL